MRPATVADAKKNGWKPSVTGILKIVYSDGLQDWIKGQIVEAAWNTDSDGYTGDYEKYKIDVLEKANEISRTAADRGGKIHDVIEKWFNGETVEGYKEWQSTFSTWWGKQEWFGNNNYGVKNEGYIPTSYGYGGRYDLFIQSVGATKIIIDYKTQNTKGKKFVFYRSWGRQLAAYAKALGATRLISVAIDSYDSKKIESYEWSNYEELLQEFECARRLYYADNNFNLESKGK